MKSTTALVPQPELVNRASWYGRSGWSKPFIFRPGTLWLIRKAPLTRGLRSQLPMCDDLFDTDISIRMANSALKSLSQDEAICRSFMNVWTRQGVIVHFSGSRLAQKSKQSMVKALQPCVRIRLFTV